MTLELSYTVDIEGLEPGDSITGVQVHKGALNTAGPLLFGLSGVNRNDFDDLRISQLSENTNRLEGVWDLPDTPDGAALLVTNLKQLRSEELYLNVLTQLHPEGAVRGQLVSGFGAPNLSIGQLAEDQVQISWLPDEPGWILQESQNLVSWMDAASGATNPIVITTLEDSQFYRLSGP